MMCDIYRKIDSTHEIIEVYPNEYVHIPHKNVIWNLCLLFEL